MKLRTITAYEARLLTTRSVHHITRITAEGWVACVVIETTHSNELFHTPVGIIICVVLVIALCVRE